MKKLYPMLWFDKNAEEAAGFYASVFKDAKINGESRYSDAGQEVHGQEPGTAMTVDLEIMGQRFVLLNGGPQFKFNEAISIVVPCDGQEELDEIWEKLSAVPEAEQCGWCKDKFGVSWQVVPSNMDELLNGPAAMEAMLKMHKIDIAALEVAGK